MIASSASDAVVVNPNVIKTLLVNGLSTFPIKGKPSFSNGPKSLPKNPPDCSILWKWVFDKFTLANELFVKAWRSLESYVIINNDLFGEFFSSLDSSTIFDKSLKVTSVPIFITGFNLLTCKLGNFTFKVLHWVILYKYYIKIK